MRDLKIPRELYDADLQSDTNRIFIHLYNGLLPNPCTYRDIISTLQISKGKTSQGVRPLHSLGFIRIHGQVLCEQNVNSYVITLAPQYAEKYIKNTLHRKVPKSVDPISTRNLGPELGVLR